MLKLIGPKCPQEAVQRRIVWDAASVSVVGKPYRTPGHVDCALNPDQIIASP